MTSVSLPFIALIKRELLTWLRTGKSILILVLFALFAAIIVAVAWPERFWEPGAIAALSRGLVGGLSMLMLLGGYLFIPGLAAVTLSLERERETHDLLCTTLIRYSGVVLGKLTNILGFYGLLLIAVMPILGAVFFLVGVDWTQLGYTLCLLLTSAFSCASAGILCSASCRRSIRSILLSYVAAAALAGALTLITFAFLASLFPGLGPAMPEFADAAFIASCPVATMGGIHAGYVTLLQVAACIVVQLVVGTLCLFLAREIFRRPPKVFTPKRAAVIDDAETLRRRRRRFPFYLIDPQKRKKPIEDGQNPVMIRELRSGLSGKTANIIRSGYLSLLLFVPLALRMAFETNTSSESIVGISVFCVIQILMVTLATPPLLANALTRESEQNQLDLLRTTLLSARQIVFGKAAAAVWCLVPALSVSLIAGLGLAGFAMLRTGEPALVLNAALLASGALVTCFVLSLGLTLCAALDARRLPSALVKGYGLGVLVFFVIPSLVMIGTTLLVPEFGKLEGFGAVAAFLSPAFAAAWALGNLASPRPGYSVAFLNTYWLANALFFNAIGISLIGASVRMFARRHMRDK